MEILEYSNVTNASLTLDLTNPETYMERDLKII